MMHIILENAGKRFNRDFIFRRFNYEFKSGRSYAVTGPNGSGKSTLLQVLSGNMQANEGSCKWILNDGKVIDGDAIYQYVSIAAPYLEIVEEMTAAEFLNFHFSFKKMIGGVSVQQIIEMTGLENTGNKQIRFFSSGMKQRMKLAQAIFSDTPVLLLDEPCTNLDANGYDLYQSLIKRYCSGKLLIVSSNDANEYAVCEERIQISDYK